MLPFAVSFIIFPLKSSIYPLFESILSVVVAVAAVLFSYLYLKSINKNYVQEGLLVGLIWFFLNIALDLIIFMPSSPLQMSFTDYITGIGLKYLIIPAVTIGMSYMAITKTNV